MTEDFLATLLGNKNRARVLRVFALGESQAITLAQVAKRAGLNAAGATREIKALERMGIIKKVKLSITVGKNKRIVTGKQKQVAWSFDNDLPYALALSRFIHATSPVQHKHIVEALKRSGRLSVVILSGNFMGDATRPADLILAIDGLNKDRLEAAVRGFEPQLGREIRYAVFSTPELRYRLTVEDRLIRDTLDYPHLVLLDKARLL